MTIVTLVHGGSGAAREAAIAALSSTSENTVAIIEGLAGAGNALDDGTAASKGLQILRIAPGCPCCTGRLAMRVILNRALRKNPDRIFLSLAPPEHLAGVINFLEEDQYRERLEIGKPVDCSLAGTGFANTGY